MTFIATFFSHYGAVSFKKKMQSKVYNLVLMPVPRSISSSCGTCARFDFDGDIEVLAEEFKELDKVVEYDGI